MLIASYGLVTQVEVERKRGGEEQELGAGMVELAVNMRVRVSNRDPNAPATIQLLLTAEAAQMLRRELLSATDSGGCQEGK